MAEYRVVKISQDEPRLWLGPHGDVHYIKVKLEGHERAVEIGKKDPNALKEGDTVHGNIIPNEGYPTDKFKAENPAFATGSTRDFKPAYKDNSDGMRQGMCFNNAANYVNAQGGTVMEGADWAQAVYDYANALYKMGDLGKEQTSLKDDWDMTINTSTTKEDDVVVDIGDGPISLDDIPF